MGTNTHIFHGLSIGEKVTKRNLDLFRGQKLLDDTGQLVLGRPKDDERINNFRLDIHMARLAVANLALRHEVI